MLISRADFRRLFHWKHSNWPTGILFSLGATLVFGGRFTFAYFCFSIAGVWAICSWLASDLLERKRPKLKRATKKNSIPAPVTKQQIKEYRLWSVVPLFVVTLLVFAICYWTRSLQIEAELSSLSGRMFPGTGPTPPNPCTQMARSLISPNDVVIIMGDNAVFEDTFPHTVLEFHKQKVFVVDKDRSTGAIVLLMEARSSDDVDP